MGKLAEIFHAQKRLWLQAQEIAQLREQINKLQMQNDSMREGMRRCVTCEYRIDYKQRQDSLANGKPLTTDAETDTNH